MSTKSLQACAPMDRSMDHVLGMACITKVTLHWTSPGKRKPGQITWHPTTGLSEVKLMWVEAQHAAQNRAKWKEIVVAFFLKQMKRTE